MSERAPPFRSEAFGRAPQRRNGRGTVGPVRAAALSGPRRYTARPSDSAGSRPSGSPPRPSSAART